MKRYKIYSITFIIIVTFLICISYRKSYNVKAVDSIKKETNIVKVEEKKSFSSINKVSNSKSSLKESLVLNKTSLILNNKEKNTNIEKNRETEELVKKEFTLTFYTSLAEENGGFEGLNAYGGQLEYGQVASNVYPEGTKIKLEGIGVFTVKDTGGKDFYEDDRLDVFIPIEEDEDENTYKERVYNLGRKKVNGYILN